MISLLTASIPERSEMLREALESVASQHLRPEVHLIGVDVDRRDAYTIYNQLLRCVDTEWVSFLDDDDLLDAHHLESLARAQKNSGADVVYAPPRCAGHDFGWYSEPFDRSRLQTRSLVPITALVRTDLVREVGGFPAERFYDWLMWRAIADTGADFLQLTEPSWTYRRHALGNRSHDEL